MVKHIEITTPKGKVLRGYLNIPNDFLGLMVLMFHGFTGNKTECGGLFRDFSRLLEANNIASLRMDFSGNGESDGSFKDFTFDTLIEEANLLIHIARKFQGVKKLCILGFSMGGAIAPMVTLNNPNAIDSLLLWSPALNIIEKIKSVYEKSPKLDNGNADYGNFEISKAMYDSLSKYKIDEKIETIRKPSLIVHGKNDISVDYQCGITYHKLLTNSKIYLVESAGHGYDKRSEKNELFKVSLAFLRGGI